MADGIEGWHFFDVESGQLPDASTPSTLPGAGKGRVVVLAATAFARQEDWAGRAAVLIARDWAQEGLRIFLMDLGLEEPSLHEVLGLPNGEGVSDAFLFGASIQHVAKAALDNAIFFAPAGAPSADPEEVLGHSRWNDLAGGFSEAEATLLLFLPTEISGAGKILSRATDIIFLAARGESAETHLGPASIKVVTTLGPLGTPAGSGDEGPAAEDDASEPEEVGGESSDDALDGLLPGFDHSLDASDFDLDGGIELAEGFGADDPLDALVDSQTEPGMAGGLESGAPEEGFDGPPEEGAAASAPGHSGGFDAGQEETVPGPQEATGGGFGAALQMGASLADLPEADAEHPGEKTTGKALAPDFGAEFIDLPPTDGLMASSPPPGDFAGDLVQGPDFGSPVPPRDPQTEEGPSGSQATPAPEPAGPTVDAEKPERRRPPRRKPPKKKLPWAGIGAVVLSLAILGSAVGTALGYLDVPGFTFLRDFFSEIPDPSLSLSGPQANEEVLRYSLVLFTYDEDGLASGVDMLDALQARLPDLLLTLVPGESDGARSYSLLAGPAVDRVEAEDLRGVVAEVLTREDPASWSVRETPRAFYLGERGTLREAEAYLASVTGGELNAYILHVTFPGREEADAEGEGTESYQILTGAFSGVQDARPLQLILRERGFRDAPLIERRGRLPE